MSLRKENGRPSSQRTPAQRVATTTDDGINDNPKGACKASAVGCILFAPLPLKGCGLGGLLGRRIIAASRICRGVFIFGLGSYAVHSLTGAPRGNPSGLMHPFEHSANLRGVAHPLGGGVDGSQNRSKGVHSMCTKHQGEGSPETLTAETVKAFISHTLSADLSDEMAARLRAASDTAFDILYRVTEGAYLARPWAPKLTESQRQDLEAFLRGVHRAVTVESLNREWRLRSGADYDEEEADHE